MRDMATRNMATRNMADFTEANENGNLDEIHCDMTGITMRMHFVRYDRHDTVRHAAAWP
jgi:hypothetical protein